MQARWETGLLPRPFGGPQPRQSSVAYGLPRPQVLRGHRGPQWHRWHLRGRRVSRSCLQLLSRQPSTTIKEPRITTITAIAIQGHSKPTTQRGSRGHSLISSRGCLTCQNCLDSKIGWITEFTIQAGHTHTSSNWESLCVQMPIPLLLHHEKLKLSWKQTMCLKKKQPYITN